MNIRGDYIMTARSFRVFATKEDLISIFNDFQQNNEIQYFKCGRMDDLIKRKNKFCLDNTFFLDQELNKETIIIDIGGIYENQALFPTEISTIWYENETSKHLYTLLKKSCKKFTHCIQNGYLIGEGAYSKRESYRFCTISIDSPSSYDLKFK